LAAYLTTHDSVLQADLYTFALVGGEVLRYSGWSGPLTVPAAAFPAGSLNHGGGTDLVFGLGPRFGRSKVTTKIGVEPTDLDIEVIAGADDLIGATPFAEAVRVGLFDGATVELDRFFAPPQAAGSSPPDTSLGAIVWFYGHLADSDLGRSRIAFKVKSLTNLLAIQQMPRRLFGASCGHAFGDAMCGYDRIAGRNAAGTATGIGAVTVSALAGSDQAHIATGFTPSPATAYDEGTIIATSGANAGASRTVKRLAGGTVYLLKPFLSPVSVDDGFRLLPGCDHTVATCNATLQNLARYGGFPYIPPPEAAA
jgi:uncharacterized phage protein (TIGR02218 family)